MSSGWITAAHYACKDHPDFAADAQDEDYSRDQEHVLNVQPTIGFRVEKVESPFSKGLKLNIVDMSGQQCCQELWQT